jgi:arylsulfatase A-like enzyme
VFAYQAVQRAIRDDRWKLIRYPRVDVTQLFDLGADPFEMHNLAADPAQAERVGEMTAQLAAELKQVGDKAPFVVAKPESPAITAKELNALPKPVPPAAPK